MNSKPILRMMVCSDIHFGESEKYPEKYTDSITEKERFESCVRFAYEYGELDAFVAVGDFVTWGTEKEFVDFKTSLGSVIKPETKILLAMASHEYFSEGVDAANEKLLRIFGKQPIEHIDIKGYSLIAASTDARCQTGLEKQAQIASELSAAAEKDREKPVFFFFHPQFQNTVYGSAVLWRTAAIMRTVMNSPQIIAFGGHSHAPTNDPRNAHQRYFTCFGTGAIVGLSCCNADRQPFKKAPDTAQFLIVEVYEKSTVKVISVDGTNGRPLREWVVEKPYDPDSFIYTDERYASAKKPTFPENAVLNAEYTDGKLKVSVTQASDGEERVPGYHFAVKNSDGYIVNQFGIGSGYHFYKLPEKAEAETELSLKCGKYTLECSAISFFDKASDKLKTEFDV
ncbi:MAG: metallophosphoesterase [Clostridia bacterium]|nr:metallophosphoesterase [Clostridia bacterium]